MRAFAVAAALTVILAAAPTFAQAPAPAAPPATPPAPQAASAEVPFPTGAKYAFVNIQRVAAESAQGKTLSLRVQALNNQKLTELTDKNKALQASQQKLDSGASVLSDTARGQLEKDIDRQQTEIQRFTDDAQKEVQDLQNELQAEFQQKLGPVIQMIAQEKKLEILFSALDAGIIWADAGLDLTGEVIRRFDAAAPVAAAPPAAAPRAAAPAPAAPRPAPAPAPAAPRPAAPAVPAPAPKK